MAVNIWIPPLLRRHLDGREEVIDRGGSISEVLGRLGAAGSEVLSSISRRAEADAGRIGLFVNGRPIEETGGLEQVVGEGDEIAIVPPIGARG